MDAPSAERRPFEVCSPHGARPDPWYWLRDDSRADPEVLAHLRAENAYKDQTLARLLPLCAEVTAELRSRIPGEYDSLPVYRQGWWYQRRFVAGAEHPCHFRRKSAADEPQLLWDADAAARAHAHYELGNLEPSPDDRWLAIAEDTVGRREYVVRFVDLATQALLADRLEGAEPDLAWLDAGRSILYVAKDPVTLLGRRVMCHRLGTPQSADRLVYEESDDAFSLGLERSRSDRLIYILLDSTDSSEVRYLPTGAEAAEPQVVIPRSPEHEYDVDDWEGDFLIRTNDTTPDFRLIRVPLSRAADRSAWVEVVAAREGVVLTDVEPFVTHLAVGERVDGQARVRVLRWSGGDERLLAAPSGGALWIGPNFDPHATVLRYAWSSLKDPITTEELDLTTGAVRRLRVEPVGGGFDASRYAVERRVVVVRDGVEVPVSILRRHPAPTESPAPVLVTGYGAYGIAQDAVFHATILSLVDRGVVYAIAHVRGGGEYGRAWHDGGRRARKATTFDDFIDVTEALVAAPGLDRRRVAAMGGSAGGLLVAAVANARPDLYRAIVAEVPFVDVVTSMLDPDLPLTTIEYDEWGDPSRRRDHRAMLAWSPYDNVRRQAYPAMLVTVGLQDGQVPYWEAVKWVQRLRECTTGDAPVLMRVDLEAGHGGLSGRYRACAETAEIYAFLLDALDATVRP
jgi:oligopeptidase B